MFNLEPIDLVLFRTLDDIQPIGGDCFGTVTTEATHKPDGKADTLTS